MNPTYKKRTKKIKGIEEQGYRAALVRPRVEHTVSGEAPSKRVIEPGNTKAEMAQIDGVERGRTLGTDIDSVKAASKEYYQALIAAHVVERIAFKTHFMGFPPCLDEERKEGLELAIAETEFY